MARRCPSPRCQPTRSAPPAPHDPVVAPADAGDRRLDRGCAPGPRSGVRPGLPRSSRPCRGPGHIRPCVVVIAAIGLLGSLLAAARASLAPSDHRHKPAFGSCAIVRCDASWVSSSWSAWAMDTPPLTSPTSSSTTDRGWSSSSVSRRSCSPRGWGRRRAGRSQTPDRWQRHLASGCPPLRRSWAPSPGRPLPTRTVRAYGSRAPPMALV